MADRLVEPAAGEVPEIPEVLESVLLYALDRAQGKLAQGEEVVPFTALAVGDTLFIETHPGETPDDCFAAAQHTVEGARGAAAYSLCYDGYVETDDGVKDALIAEGGIPGQPEGVAIAYLYDAVDGSAVVAAEPVYVGPAPNFMEHANDPLPGSPGAPEEGALEPDAPDADEDGPDSAPSQPDAELA